VILRVTFALLGAAILNVCVITFDSSEDTESSYW